MWPGKSSLKSNRAGFLDHLEELRTHLLISLLAIGIFSAAAYFFSQTLIDFLTLPLGKGKELYFHAPYEAFLVHLKVSLGAGFFLASPVWITQLWLFLAPGLHRKERRIFFPLILASAALFFLGACFAFGVLVPFGLRFLLSFQTESLTPLLGIWPYFSFLLGTVLASGLVFNLPVVILGLVRSGALTAERLRHSRKIAAVTLLLLAAVLTPSADPVGQILLAFPLILLYEGCVGIARWVEKGKK